MLRKRIEKQTYENKSSCNIFTSIILIWELNYVIILCARSFYASSDPLAPWFRFQKSARGNKRWQNMCLCRKRSTYMRRQRTFLVCTNRSNRVLSIGMEEANNKYRLLLSVLFSCICGDILFLFSGVFFLYFFMQPVMHQWVERDTRPTHLAILSSTYWAREEMTNYLIYSQRLFIRPPGAWAGVLRRVRVIIKYVVWVHRRSSVDAKKQATRQIDV
jgi:hypothetical protein